MARSLLLFLLICFYGAHTTRAQWTAKDSLWLEGILSGKDTLRLNPETMDAIRGGSFLNREKPNTPMMEASPEIPLVKDFKEYLQLKDSTREGRIAVTNLPSFLFIRFYNPEMPRSRYQVSEQFDDYMKQALSMYKTSAGHDFVHVLNMAFSPEYRQWIRNQKRAKLLKYYNELPSPVVHEKMKTYRAAHPENFQDLNKSKKKPLPLPLVRSSKKDSLSTNQSSSVPDSTSLAIPVDSLEYKMPPN